MRPSGNEAGLMLCAHASALPDLFPPKLTIRVKLFPPQFSATELIVQTCSIDALDRGTRELRFMGLRLVALIVVESSLNRWASF
jgi:hypothetical protein